MASYQSILTELDRGVGIVTLNRPERHNVVDELLVTELSAAFDAMVLDPAVRLIVLSSVGAAFSAGGDPQWLHAGADKTEADHLAEARATTRLLQAIAESPKPTVARIQGSALGSGLGLVAACDVAIATFDVEFAVTETRRGAVPSVIAPYLVAAIGQRHAKRYILTAERFSAAEAYRLGLVHEIVADDTALDAALADIISALLGNSPHALAESKAALSALDSQPRSALVFDQMAERSARARVSADGAEGFQAFLEKRLPSWAQT